MIGPKQTPTMRGHQYISIFTNNYLGYTENFLLKAKSEAPACFQEYLAKAEVQYPKKKDSSIRVDGCGDNRSREKLLKFLAEKGISREISPPYSLQQNGLTERYNCSVKDPA
jgi:hypothetical protein